MAAHTMGTVEPMIEHRSLCESVAKFAKLIAEDERARSRRHAARWLFERAVVSVSAAIVPYWLLLASQLSNGLSHRVFMLRAVNSAVANLSNFAPV